MGSVHFAQQLQRLMCFWHCYIREKKQYVFFHSDFVSISRQHYYNKAQQFFYKRMLSRQGNHKKKNA